MTSLRKTIKEDTNKRAEELWAELFSSGGFLKVEYDNTEWSAEIREQLASGIDKINGFKVPLDTTHNLVVYITEDCTVKNVINSRFLFDESVVKA